MKYALNLTADGRILSATYERFARAGAVLTDTLPEGNVADYRYVEGGYVYDPLPETQGEAEPTEQEDISALLVDHEYRLTLLELGLAE